MSSPRQTRNPIGLKVESYELRGREQNVDRQWIGADLLLRIPPVGEFLVNLVTKEHYVNEQVSEALFDVRSVEKLLEDPCEREERQPFVLNDAVITEEILDRKFIDRTVEEDLARSLWPVAAK